jgi:hypothetical protein
MAREMTVESTRGVTDLAMVVDYCYLTVRGWTLALAGPHHQLGGALVRDGSCVGLLLVVELM